MRRRFLYDLGSVLVVLVFIVLKPVFTHADDSVQKLQVLDPEFLQFWSDRADVTRGTFDQVKHIEKYNVALKTNGKFQVEANGLRWITLRPSQSNTLITPRYVQTTMGEQNIRTPLVEGSYGAILAGALSSLLSLNLDDIQKSFTVSTLAIEAGWQLDLQPTQALAHEIQHIRLLILDTETSLSFLMTHIQGDQTHLTLHYER